MGKKIRIHDPRAQRSSQTDREAPESIDSQREIISPDAAGHSQLQDYIRDQGIERDRHGHRLYLCSICHVN